MNATGHDLLRGILDDPASDERRLIYADWLEEQGEAERGEFLRKAVQYPHAEFVRLTGGPLHPFYLLGMQGKESTSPWHWGDTGEGVVVTDEVTGIMYHPDRGLVSEVHCRLADWIGTECDGVYEYNGSRCRKGWLYTGMDGMKNIPCGKCAGLGRVGAHGPPIVRCQPVTRVVVTDMEPTGPIEHGPDAGQWFLIRRDVGCLWPFLDAAAENMATAHYLTRQAAIDALSAALLRWAKETAKQLEERP